jgi:hypothetical protein
MFYVWEHNVLASEFYTWKIVFSGVDTAVARGAIPPPLLFAKYFLI